MTAMEWLKRSRTEQTAGHVAEELLELRPKRELTEDSQNQGEKAKMNCAAGRKQSGCQPKTIQRSPRRNG
jgi:hypothetical protein